jgi:hypothetical protein
MKFIPLKLFSCKNKVQQGHIDGRLTGRKTLHGFSLSRQRGKESEQS